MVCGAGGAARAVVWELSRTPGMQVVIANRHLARARQLARWLRARRRRVRVDAVALRQVDLAGATLVVNATTLGMRARDPLPMTLRGLARGTFVYDLVYHRETPLVRAARRRGCVAANGRSMLLYQGAESYRLWLRRSAPVAVMRQALMRALS